MRLSEKTVELNICAQVTSIVRSPQRLFWFGLTQKQEARAGFDACTKLGGRLLVFQFKASAHQLKNGDRRFHAPHAQMQNLRRQVQGRRLARSVFYAFPLVGTTAELNRTTDLVANTWLLDVGQLPSFPPPMTRRGTLRKNGCHNIDVNVGRATIRSDPVSANLLPRVFTAVNRTAALFA